MAKETYYAYTDGSCLKNPDGPGGWACIVFDKFGTPIKCSGFAPSTTNQRMELIAVIQAIKLVPSGYPVVIYSDSAYVCNSISKGWLTSWIANGWKTSTKSQVANKDLWMVMVNLLEDHDVTMKWVRGHASNIFNNECDSMARDISTFAKDVADKFNEYVKEMG